jgi:pyruvate/2-oxoglutarate dehydrogenase complex dihydrolipoamide dehydrogenase (E3) component
VSDDPDLLVIGGGAAGLAAARTGARLKRRVTMLQDGPVGGECTFTGCVPSKTLLESAAAGLGFDAAMGRVHADVDRIAATETAPVLREEGIEVAEGRATGVRGVWAAGDVTGRLLFTHAADEMGRTAAFNALRWPLRKRVRERSVPRVTFTDPEVARVGLTESEAASAGRAVVAELPMSELDRAIVAGRTEGFVKLISQPRLRTGALGRLAGATVVAPHAGEVIHELALAVRTGMTVARLAQTVHAYPTWSAAVRSAAAQFLFSVGGRAARPAAADR